MRSLQKLSTKWKVRYFREKKKLQAAEEKNRELLNIIQQSGAGFPDLRARRPGEPLRHYDEDEEVRALALYFQGPRAYRFLQQRYVLPHPRTLRRKMERIVIRPGFHTAILALMKAKFSSASDKDKLCVISFDEMQVKPRIVYQRSEGVFEGFADHGSLGRTAVCANHALVMMVRGITKHWKQPIGYFLSAGPTKAAVQKQLLTECIQRVTAAGMTVVATTCDMSQNNQATYTRLGAADSGLFNVDGREVVALYDVPHLFKCIRNAFKNYSIKVDGEQSSWRYLEELFALESATSPRAAPKLTQQHIWPNNFEKMKVRYALQVMSQTVSAAIKLYVSVGKLPRAALPTANLLLRLNSLLDVLNSSKRFDPCFKRRAISNLHPATAEQHMQTLQESDAWLQRWTVGNGASIDSIGGLHQTIQGVTKVWDVCQAAGCSFLCTRRLNQDALENFFSVVRQRGGGMDNPDPTHFRHLYKHASLNNLLASPTTSSCAEDGDGLLAVLRQVTNGANDEQEPVQSRPASIMEPDCEDHLEISLETRNILTYVTGNLLCKAKLSCCGCKTTLTKDATMPLADTETFTALKSYTAISPGEVGSLLRPTEDCDAFIVACYRTFKVRAKSMVLETKICERLVNCALAKDEAQRLAQQVCHPAVLQTIASTYIRMELHRMSKDLVRTHAKAASKSQGLKTSAKKKMNKLKPR